jgi:hypothetical protein
MRLRGFLRAFGADGVTPSENATYAKLKSVSRFAFRSKPSHRSGCPHFTPVHETLREVERHDIYCNNPVGIGIMSRYLALISHTGNIRIVAVPTHFVIYLFLFAIIIVLALLSYLRIRTNPAYHQEPNEVVTREPGKKILGAPQPIAPQAHADLAFALLSQAAYQGKSDAKKARPSDWVDAVTILEAAGWTLWADFPDQKLLEKISKFHLRVEVWSNASLNAVAVAFGGTVFTNIEDWEANLRWFIPHHKDEYTMVVKTFGRDFVTDYLQRSAKSEFAFLRHADIFSTGHSLGGGLAQQFAYSLPENAGVPRVKKVFAFDPSPVTGFYSVRKGLRDYDKQNLAIDRIYERGEILAYLRSLTNYFFPPSASSPTIRQVRYNLFYTLNPFAGHSIVEFACKLYKVCQGT